MKRFKEFIIEAKKNKSIVDDWFNAITGGDIEKVKSLIKKGIDVNVKFENWGFVGDTGLMLSCAYGSTKNNCNDIAKLLLKQPEIDINIINEVVSDFNALFYACHNNNKLLAKLLFQRPEIDIENKSEGLDIIKHMIQYNIEPSFLRDYIMQKKILENGRDDIIFLFNNYGLVNSKIKKEHPELFKAADWGLI